MVFFQHLACECRWVLPLPGSTLMERQCMACTHAMSTPPPHRQHPPVPSLPIAWGAPKLTENEHGFGLEESHSPAPVGRGGWVTQIRCGRRGLPSQLAVPAGCCTMPNPTGALFPLGSTLLNGYCRSAFIWRDF